MSSRAKVIAGVAAVVIIGGAVAAFALSSSTGVEVATEKAVRGTLGVTVSASGSVGKDEKADVYPPAAGTLASVNVTEGQTVKAGDVLAVMDTEPLEMQVAQAQAAYKAALAQQDALSKTTPSAADKKAAQAAVNAAYQAFLAADAQYDSIVASKPSAEAISYAEDQVAQAQGLYDAANQAYQDFAAANPAPRDAVTEAALAGLQLVRDQAYANLLSAKANLGQLLAAQNNTAALATARAAKDQAWAGYQAALSQQVALEKGGDTSAARSSADAGVEAARLALDLANEALAEAELKAPIDGVVLFNGAAGALGGGELGALGGAASSAGKAAEGSAVSPASAPFTVVAFDALTFNAQVDEADIDRIEVGMKAVVTLDAIMDADFETAVERIDKTSVVTPTGGTAFPVVLRLLGAADRVLLGMNGSVDIEVEAVEGATTVPIEAVLDEAGTSFAYVVRDGKAVKVEVTTGRLTDTRAEILSGVAEGDEVVVSGFSDLEDGAKVKVK